MSVKTPDREEKEKASNACEVTLVVCTLNEERNVRRVLERIPPVVSEILVVDGHSTDATVEEARRADERVRIILQPGRGKGNALRTGFASAHGRVVVQMDADGSMDPAEIPRYVEAIREGADVVKGSRMAPGGRSTDLTAFRRFGNRCFCYLANTLHRTDFTDICYGFMAFRKEALDHLEILSDGFDIEAELAVKASRAGYRVVEVPTYERDRFHGHSNLSAFRDGWDILRTIARPDRLAGRRTQSTSDVRVRQTPSGRVPVGLATRSRQ